MSYLVTGGAGFVGAYVARRLLDEGEKVVIYDSFIGGNAVEKVLGGALTGVPAERGDINDLAHLIDTVQRHNVDTIIHMAYLLTDASRANPRAALKVNCEGLLNMLEVVRLAKLRKVVWASSLAVFGHPKRYKEEYLPNDAPQYPAGVYGACKSFGENMATHYFDEYGVDSTALRFSIVYGVGKQRGAGAFTAELIDKPALGQPGRVPYGSDTVDWLYVEDAARAVVAAARVTRTKTRAFNVLGDLRPMSEAVAFVRSLLPDVDISVKPGYFGAAFKVDTSRVEEEIGYKPEWSMERGLRTTINLIRSEHGLPPVG